MTAQGPELRALADTLREAGEKATGGPWFVHDFGREDGVVYLGIEPEDGPAPIGELSRAADCAAIVLLRNNLPTIISALERAAVAEGEKAKGRCPTCTPQTGTWVRHERNCATEREADWW